MRLATLLGPDIKQILKEDPDQLQELLDEIHAEDLADIISELEPDEAAQLLARLPAEDAAPIFERLEEHEQEEVALEMPPESVAHIASEMAPDDRADFLGALPEEAGERIERVLESVYPEAAEEVREIEKWPETSAGHMMTTQYVAITPEMTTVADAIGAVRERARDKGEFVYTAYALGPRGELAGVASLRDLMIAEPEDKLWDMLRTNVITVLPTADREDAARKMAKYDLIAMPVVDDKGILLGVITIDDVVDVLVQEQTEDVQKIGGIEPLDLPYFQTSFATFIRKRAVWLVILFVEEFFTQTALRYYDPVMEAVKGALLYVPLLISTGGNSGSQSSTLIIRGLAIGEIRLKDWFRILVREAGMGLVLGLIVAVIAFGRVLMYKDQHVPFALTVGITVICIVVAGCSVGAMLPIIMKRVGVDPATSSTPFIASLVDTLGVIIYATVAQIVMSDVIAAAHATPGAAP
jgi:magnesium transporter